MSVLSKAPRPSGDDVKRVALAALAAALENGNQEHEKSGKRSGPMKGVKTLAAGAALYVAGRAAYKNRDTILDQLQGEQDDDPEAEGDEDFDEEDEEEPVAEEDEDFDEEDEEEPEAEEDEDFDEEDEEEPEAEEDEDFEDEEEPEAEEDDDFYDEDDEDINPVDRPPEPPEAEEDEDEGRPATKREPAGRR